MASAATRNGATPASNATTGEGGKKAKAQATGQKVMVRHLPPLITEEEVQVILGEEWKIGNGKVDWVQFQQGKVPKSSFKEPRPSLYALHLTKEEDVPIFKDFVLRTPWQDAKNTYTTSAFQVHALDVATRVPPTKHRVDPRQGTIDQDPEFQAFLHSLTQPKEAQSKDAENNDQVASTNDDPKEKPVSHLVKYIQEKKAAKAKEAAAAKNAKHNRQDSQGGKAKAGEDSKKKGKDSKVERFDKEKDKDKLKESVPKLLTKKAAQEAAAEAAKQVAGQITATKASDEAIPKSRRANIAHAAKILQRDLGLSPGSAHRRARQNAAKVEPTSSNDPPATATVEKETTETKELENSKKNVPTGPKVQVAEGSRRTRGKAKAVAAVTSVSEPSKGKTTEGLPKPTTGPIILLKKEIGKKEEPGARTSSASTTPGTNLPTSVASASSVTPAPPTGPKAVAGKGGAAKSTSSAQQKKATTQPGSGAIRAFVKHANPSQGITETLLKQAMETFGSVTFVEIDKRKGFAYVDFGDSESLRKAVAASPVSIAQGTVQVLERKDKKPAASASSPSSSTPSEKIIGDSQAATAAATATATATSSSSTERPKRGNRGRGRRGGGAAANSTTGTTGTSHDTASSAAPAAG